MKHLFLIIIGLIYYTSCTTERQYNDEELLGTWRLEKYNDGSRFPSSTEEMYIGYYSFEKNKEFTGLIMDFLTGSYQVKNNKLYIQAIATGNNKTEAKFEFDIISISKNKLVLGNKKHGLLVFTSYDPKDTSKFEEIINDENIKEVIFEEIVPQPPPPNK